MEKRIEPTGINSVLGGVAGRFGHGERDPSLGAVGVRFVTDVSWVDVLMRTRKSVIDNQGVTNVADHLVPDLTLIRAHKDAHAVDGGVDDLEVPLDVGVGRRVERLLPLSGSRTTSDA